MDMQSVGEIAGQPGQAPVAAPAPIGRVSGAQDKAVERPRQLLRGGLKYVNDMLNIGWIAGFAHTLDQRTFLLQQNNNLEHALRVAVDPARYDTKRLARRPLTVQVHIRGTRDEHGPQAVAHCIGIEHPNVMDLPAQKVWLAGFGTSLSGRLLLLDGKSMSWRELALKKDPGCPVCSARSNLSSK